MTNDMNYFEIGTPDPEASKAFYGALFDWTFGEPFDACPVQRDRRQPRRTVGHLADGRRQLGSLLRPGRRRTCWDRAHNSSARQLSCR